MLIAPEYKHHFVLMLKQINNQNSYLLYCFSSICREEQSLLVEAHLILLNTKEKFLFLDRFCLKLAKCFVIQFKRLGKTGG